MIRKRVYTLKDGRERVRWQADIRLGRDGKAGRRIKSFDKKSKAAAWEAEQRAALADQAGGRVSTSASRQTLAYYLWAAVDAKAKALGHPGDRASYRSPDAPYELRQWAGDAERVGESALARRRMDRVSGEDIDNLLAERLTKVRPATVRRHELNIIRAAFKAAAKENARAPGWEKFRTAYMRDRFREARSTGRTRRESVSGSKRSRVVPPEAEARLIAAAAAREQALAIIVSVETGMRQSELFRAEWYQVEWEARELWLPGDTTKSRNPRTILLTRRAVEALRELRALNPTGDALFGPWTQNALRLAWKRLKRRAVQRAAHEAVAFASAIRRPDDPGAQAALELIGGAEVGQAAQTVLPVLQTVRWHDFRHTAITRWLDAGVRAHDTAAMSGHNLATVLANYAHGTAAGAREALDAMDAAAAGAK